MNGFLGSVEGGDEWQEMGVNTLCKKLNLEEEMLKFELIMRNQGSSGWTGAPLSSENLTVCRK